MYGNDNHEFNVKVAKNTAFNHYVNQANIDLNNRLNHEYQNRMREIRDLLYNPEQTGMLIDEMASFVYSPASRRWSTPTAPCGTTTRSWPVHPLHEQRQERDALSLLRSCPHRKIFPA